ncbi:Zn-dependent hydrolase [Haloarcula japonica]|uniref:N-carbamyol-L-amino acid amidohydrolase n=1 Tax=Haloarcula japonica (strain ATCC 49778 / DSM 6131 / JCM 7785 / NBRC 101032 / NCIMB 13157 / TR-1) TaxID=1227453 RepID=M0L5T4_HALJT|nr:Zn-dependent hydrolase [Haloarcula japonica]EMA28448.1 N-carbamyol-L-amino acid amidohydrolase [Haloarcula japonica DSM 6131]
MDTQIDIDAASLRADVERTGEFGSVDADTGVGRTALPADDANVRAREYLVDRMKAVGLDVRIDAVGNIAGRWTPSTCDPDAPPVAAGSHLDSVPQGGIFDGVLGVYAALEAVRAIRDSGVVVNRPLEVVSFTGEEGTRFADGVLGSSVAAGELSVEDALALSDGRVSLRTALEEAGFRGTGRLDASEWHAWVELHIEQGGHLETAGVPLGVVTDITGTTRGHVSIDGRADHSGTTAMDARRDALVAASELVLDVEATASEIATTGTGTAVGTVGRLIPTPNAVNVVPGSVSMRLDLRSVEQLEIDRQARAVKDSLDSLERQHGVETSLDIPYEIPPTRLSERVRDTVETAASRRGVETLTLHSGAGHDTMQVANVTDAALLFVPSTGGHSHSPKEWADWSDCAVATQVLAESLALLASNTEHNQHRTYE